MNYTNSQIRDLIAEHIHNADDRKMLHLRLIDGMTFEQIGFEMGMTTKTVRLRIHKGEEILFKHIPG
jgi:DNA-directed RNA polymerase specialized sigma24 family protein